MSIFFLPHAFCPRRVTPLRFRWRFLKAFFARFRFLWRAARSSYCTNSNFNLLFLLSSHWIAVAFRARRLRSELKPEIKSREWARGVQRSETRIIASSCGVSGCVCILMKMQMLMHIIAKRVHEKRTVMKWC